MSRRATRYNKRDANEPDIVKALAQMGVTWFEGGPLDGWIFINEWIPVEIKMPEGTFRQSQKDFLEKCRILDLPRLVLHSVDEAINAVNSLRAIE